MVISVYVAALRVLDVMHFWEISANMMELLIGVFLGSAFFILVWKWLMV